MRNVIESLDVVASYSQRKTDESAQKSICCNEFIVYLFTLLLGLLYGLNSDNQYFSRFLHILRHRKRENPIDY